jgi:hypothetical protein
VLPAKVAPLFSAAIPEHERANGHRREGRPQCGPHGLAEGIVLMVLYIYNQSLIDTKIDLLKNAKKICCVHSKQNQPGDDYGDGFHAAYRRLPEGG